MDPAKPLTNETAVASSTLHTAIRSFIQHCRVLKSLSDHTLRAYFGDLLDFVQHAGSESMPPKIGPDVITTYVESMRERRHLKETTIRRRIATLKILFRWLERNRIVGLSVFHDLDLSVRIPKRLPRALDPSDMRRLLITIEDRHWRRRRCRRPYDQVLMQAVVVALFSTGIRIGELVAVRLADVSLPEASILVHGKGNRERRVYLAGRGAISSLRLYLSDRRRIAGEGDHLFVKESGSPVSAGFIRAKLRSLAGRAGLRNRVTPHMLRHTAATQLLDAGVDIRFVQKLLGHSSIATTQIYTQVTDSMLKAKLEGADTLRRVLRPA